MRNYKKITQNAEGQLLAWYGFETKYEGSEMDFDVLTEYEITKAYDAKTYYPIWIVKSINTNYTIWKYHIEQYALDGLLEYINEKKKLADKIEQAGAKFQEVVNTNSLDQRYKDVVVEKKLKTNEQLREKYAVARMNTTARLNRAYYSRLLDH